MYRRDVLLGLGAVALAGCDTAVSTSGTSAPAASALAAASVPADALSMANAQIAEVEINVNRGMGRPFYYAGFAPEKVHGVLSGKLRSTLNAANPGGRRATRAVVKLSAITIADGANPKAKSFDSVIIASARFYDIATGQEVGERTKLGAQATYRPRFLDGIKKLQTPQEELELITSYSTAVLAKSIYG